MGVISPYKTFTFDGESSADYGVYLTGEGVFNAPERSVEMVEIPGRNGNFALDKGKFENISVTYRVGMFDDDEENFADKVSAFRNWLCSKVGYVRLSDDYNPNEYRMAVYLSGLEVDHDFLIAGEAEITFDCKPQRWLTSGEAAVSVADGGTLDNPTLFESEPLLAVEGYGNIAFNGYDISIDDVVLGNVILNDGGTFTASSKSLVFNPEMVNVGDSLSLNISVITIRITTLNKNSFWWDMTGFTSSDSNASFSTGYPTMTSSQTGTNSYVEIPTTMQTQTFVVGTSSTITNTTTFTLNGKRKNSSTTFSITGTITQTITYTPSTNTIKVSTLTSATSSNANVEIKSAGGRTLTLGQIEADSTVSALGHPTYIDCDIGECYMIDSNDEIVQLNQYIDLGSDLPELASGTNTINYDNTITSLEVTPRWWKV